MFLLRAEDKHGAVRDEIWGTSSRRWPADRTSAKRGLGLSESGHRSASLTHSVVER